MRDIANLRKELREIVTELRESRDKLLELRRSIPAPPTTEDDLDAEPEPAAEMAAVIECGLHDCLGPLIRDLTDVAAYGETG